MELTPRLSQKISQLLDKDEILGCIHRYCRGMDRMDRALVLSAYHPGAKNDFGFYIGDAEGLVDWGFAYHGALQEHTHHMIMNHTVDLDGDVAHGGTYWLFSGVNRNNSQTPIVLGRCLDRFERREDKWGIVSRVCVTEWIATGVMPASERIMSSRVSPHLCARDRTDVSYERPLEVGDN